jgi:hypothetical protein
MVSDAAGIAESVSVTVTHAPHLGLIDWIFIAVILLIVVAIIVWLFKN